MTQLLIGEQACVSPMDQRVTLIDTGAIAYMELPLGWCLNSYHTRKDRLVFQPVFTSDSLLSVDSRIDECTAGEIGYLKALLEKPAHYLKEEETSQLPYVFFPCSEEGREVYEVDEAQTYLFNGKNVVYFQFYDRIRGISGLNIWCIDSQEPDKVQRLCFCTFKTDELVVYGRDFLECLKRITWR